MKRYASRLIAYRQFFGLVGLCAILGYATVPSNLQAQAQSSDLANESVVVETEIPPTGRITVKQATLRTPAEMEQAEAARGPASPMSNEGLEVPFMPTDDPGEYEAAKAAADAAAAAGAARSSAPVPLAPPTLRIINIEGINELAAGTGGFRFFPPDTHGAVGPSRFVQVVNHRIVVFNKAEPTPAQISSTSLEAFFGLGTDTNIFDPRIVYDQVWNRWVIVATRRSTSATDTVRRFLLAVSTTGNPAGSYFIYSVPFGGGPFDNGDWWDFPGLGMDQDAVIVTGNVFDTPTGPFKFAAMLPVAKARVYNGLGFSVPIFTGLAGTLQPPIVFGQNKNAYLVAANNFTHLHLYRGENLSNAFQATLVLQAHVDVPDYAVPPNAPQVGSALVLDTADRRFVTASTQVGDSLWNVHTIKNGAFAAPKFYQIDTEGAGANTVKQQGFFFESATSFDFNASIAANASGEAFVTWNSTDVSNANVSLRHNARIRFSGRQPADALGVIGAGSSLFTSSVALTGDPTGSSVQRWGDYSAVSLDPTPTSTCSANRRAWVVNEKINNTTPVTTWGSRIARIGFCN
jgi:hypothetical protein